MREPTERELMVDTVVLLDLALDLIPRMDEDDPAAPALADWCIAATGLSRRLKHRLYP